MPAGWSSLPRDDHGAHSARSPAAATTAARHPHAPVVVELGPWGVCAREASRRERLWSHVHADELDRRLAAGRAPEGSPLLALRAQQLACPATRQSLATTIGRLLRAADKPPGRFAVHQSAAVLHRLRATRALLAELVDRLLAPVPVSAHGVALVRVLLRDGSGPLFRFESGDDLGAQVSMAIAALDPVCDWGL
jgi:hypothetical protein